MGRKTVIVGGLFGCMVGSVCLTWVPSFTVFAVLLFAIHSSSMAAYMACFVFGAYPKAVKCIPLNGPARCIYSVYMIEKFKYFA